MSVTLLVTITGKPGHGQALTDLIKPVPADNDIGGCSGMEVFVNSANADQILIVEQWESIAAHKSFLASVIADGGLDGMLEHAADVRRVYYSEVAD